MGDKLTMTEAEEFTILPEDTIITVRVDSTKVKTVQLEGRDPWDKLEFAFEIIDAPAQFKDDVVGTRIYGDVSFRLTDHPDNRLRQWLEALLGIELSVGFELDTDMLPNRQAKAVVSNYERRKGGKGHKVGALIPGTPAAVAGVGSSAQQQAEAALGGGQPQPVAATAGPQQDDLDIPF